MAKNKTQNKKTILIIAPHPDDELVGCGGVYLQNARKGNDVRVIYLTTGSLKGEERKAKIRRDAVTRIARELSIQKDNLIFLDNYETGYLLDVKKAKKAIEEIRNAIEEITPDEVYVTAYEGGNIDHDLANLFVATARKKVRAVKKMKYYEYEVYNNYVPISLFGIKKMMQIIIREIVKITTRKYFYWDDSRFPKAQVTKSVKLKMTLVEIEDKIRLFDRYRLLAEKPLGKKEPRKLLSPYKAEDLLQEMIGHDYSTPPHKQFPLPLGYELAWKIKFTQFKKIAEKLQKNR